MSDEQQPPRDDNPEDLLNELDSLKALLDTPEPEPVEVELPLEAEAGPQVEVADPPSNGGQAPVSAAAPDEPMLEPTSGPIRSSSPAEDEAVPTLDEAVPVLEMVDEVGAAPSPAVPPREELEALIDILIERRLPAVREQLRAELLADLGLEG